MVSQRIANIVFALLLLAVVGYMSWLAWNFQTNPFGDATLPTKFFPLFVLGSIGLFTTLYALEYIFRGGSGGDGDQVFFDSISGFVRSLLTIAVVLATYIVWRQKGIELPGLGTVPAFAVAGILLPIGTALAMGCRSLIQLGVIVVATVLIYFAFRFGLNVRFS